MSFIEFLRDLLPFDISINTLWIAIGFAGQALFTMRFLVQWIASERAKKSVIPISFWYFSIGGSFVLLAYAIHQEDPVFILGQAMGFLIYFRNLAFIAKAKHNETK